MVNMTVIISDMFVSDTHVPTCKINFQSKERKTDTKRETETKKRVKTTESCSTQQGNKLTNE